MKQIVALGGEPATGKTSLVRGLIVRLGGLNAFHAFKFGLLQGLWNKKEQVMILGIYGEETFAGTDRLSMAVINDAIQFLENTSHDHLFGDTTMIFEGDRLFNKRFLRACMDHAPTHIMVLEVSEEQKEVRHRKRRDNQSATWLKSRKTKLNNLLSEFPEARRFRNENEIDLIQNSLSILSLTSRKETHA